MASLVPVQSITSRVSSVLGRDAKSYGKQYLFDGCDDTSWCSDQGTPQWISLKFSNPITLTGFVIQFHGGFVPKSICLQRSASTEEEMKLETVATCYPVDSNAVQNFHLPESITQTDNLRLLFPESTDFFGRITVYKLAIFQA